MNNDILEWILERSLEAYDAENKSTDKIRERISFLVSMAFTPCLAISAYLISSLKGDLFSNENLFYFWVPIVFTIVLIISSACYVGYVLLSGFKYSRIPSPSHIIEYINKHPDQSVVLYDAQIGLLNQISQSVDENYKTNQHRKSKLLSAQRLAFYAFIALFFCIPRWVYDFINFETRPQPIKIILPIKVTQDNNMTTQQTQKQPEPSSTQNQQQTTNQLKSQEKPSFPQRTMALDSANNIDKPIFPTRSFALESYDPKIKVDKK